MSIDIAFIRILSALATTNYYAFYAGGLLEISDNL